MKVYILWATGDYYGPHFVEVFTSLEKAQAHAEAEAHKGKRKKKPHCRPWVQDTAISQVGDESSVRTWSATGEDFEIELRNVK